MTIITKPAGGVLKGLPATFTLNKSQVLALSIVSNDDYFSDSSNWKKIILKYESSEGKQQELVRFDATLASPTGFFLVSEQARDLFEIKSLKIVDFDGDVLVVPRSSLVAAEFDVDFGEPVFTGTYLTYELNTVGATLNATGGVSGGNPSDDVYAKDSSGATGDFTYEWKFNWSSINPFNVFFGVTGTYGSGLWYDNLTCLEGTNTNPEKARLWVNGTPSVLTNISIPDQENIYKLTRVGTTISHYLNGVLIHSSTVALFTAYPTVRTKGLAACLESYIPSAPAVQAVTWNVAGKTGVGTVTAGANGLITKSGGGAGYNVNVLSNETITGDGYVEFVNSASFVNVVFGLAEVNSSSGSFENLIIGGYNTGGGALEKVSTTGNMQVTYGGGVGQIVNGSIVRFERIGTNYSIKINGTEVFSISINNTNPLKASATVYGETYGVNNVTISG